MDNVTGEILRENVLLELVGVLGDAGASALLQKFFDDLATQLASVQAHRKDIDAVAVILHKVVGMSGALGLDQLARASLTLNGRAKEGSEEITPEIWDVYDEISNKALEALAMWRREQLA